MTRGLTNHFANTAAASAGQRRADVVGSSQRHRSDEVERWVAMLNAELEEESPESVADSLPASPPAVRAVTRSQTGKTADQTVAVQIEFGRTRIEDSGELSAGTLIRLDQLADEPLDVVVNGRPYARGELVVVDGKLGVRIVEILAVVMLALSCLTPRGKADEGPNRSSLLQIDAESPEIFDTPFGTTRGRRPPRERDTVPRDTTSTTARETLSESHTLEPGAAGSEVTAPVRLTKPSTARHAANDKSNKGNSDSASQRASWNSTALWLIVVSGVIVAGARWLKSQSPAVAKSLPNDVLDVLGRKVIDQRTSIVLVRCGSRVLVLSSSASGLRTLAEITDPVEADCLAGLCRANGRDQGVTETFRSLLQRLQPAKTAVSPRESVATAAAAERRWPERFVTPNGGASSEVRS